MFVGLGCVFGACLPLTGHCRISRDAISFVSYRVVSAFLEVRRVPRSSIVTILPHQNIGAGNRRRSWGLNKTPYHYWILGVMSGAAMRFTQTQLMPPGSQQGTSGPVSVLPPAL